MSAEIRREVIERLARFEWEDHHRSEMAVFGETWEKAPTGQRDTYLMHADRAVRQIEDLLPAEAQWKTYGDAGETPGWFPDKASALAAWDRVQEQCAEMVGESVTPDA